MHIEAEEGFRRYVGAARFRRCIMKLHAVLPGERGETRMDLVVLEDRIQDEGWSVCALRAVKGIESL